MLPRSDEARVAHLAVLASTPDGPLTSDGLSPWVGAVFDLGRTCRRGQVRGAADAALCAARRAGRNVVKFGPPGAPANPANCAVFGVNGLSSTFTDDRLDYRAVVDYDITDDLMAYVQYSTGYKSGGVNPRPFVPDQAQPFNPETVEAYEVGLKSFWFDRRVRLNGAVFHNEYQDIQLTFTTCPASSAPAPAPHAVLGATEIDRRKDYYGPGDERIVSRIDRAAFERLRPKYERLGFVPPAPAAGRGEAA